MPKGTEMVRKAFKSALLIQIIAAVVGVIGMVVDGAVTGSCLGTEAMAAFGLATPAVTVFVACSGVCELGTSMLIGRLVGARKTEEASKALSACLAFAVGFSLLLTVTVLLFSERIAGFLGAEGALTQMTAGYLRGFCFCAPALFLLTVLMPVMQIEGNKRAVVLAVITMTLVNITGDLLVGLVFKGGLFGMALATTVSYFAALLLMLPCLFKKGNALRVSFRGLKGGGYIGTMISGGLPNALQQLCRSLLTFLLNKRLLAIADENAVAAFTVIMSAANICMALGSGIGSSVSMLTGVFAGDRDDRAIRELVLLALKKAVLYDAGLCVLLLLGTGMLMPVFSSDPALLALAVPGFRLYCLSMIGYAVNVTLRLYYQAMHFSLLSYGYVLCDNLLFTAIGAYLLSALFGVKGVWLSFLFGETVTLCLLAAWTLFKTEKSGTILERALFIPKEMTADVLARFDGAAENAPETAALSGRVQAFCTENGADPRTAYALALAAEELGTFILSRNAGKGERVEVRVLCKKEGWIMSVRDNGKRLDPLSLLSDNSRRFDLAAILREEGTDDFAYIGLRLVLDMNPKTEYLETLNINNLNIETER